MAVGSESCTLERMSRYSSPETTILGHRTPRWFAIKTIRFLCSASSWTGVILRSSSAVSLTEVEKSDGCWGDTVVFASHIRRGLPVSLSLFYSATSGTREDVKKICTVWRICPWICRRQKFVKPHLPPSAVVAISSRRCCNWFLESDGCRLAETASENFLLMS